MSQRNVRVYLDQNLLGYVRDGRLPLARAPNVDWVYSDEHFKEVARSGDDSFIRVLDELGAWHLEIVLDENRRITDKALLSSAPKPSERYSRWKATRTQFKFLEEAAIAILARVHGADLPDLSKLPAETSRRLTNALTQGGIPLETSVSVSRIQEELLSFAISNLGTASLESNRKAIGTHGGRIGTFQANPVKEIWDIIGTNIPGVTADQFFGFEPIDKQGYDTWPRYLGIISCYMALNFLGYGTDKGIAKTATWPRILSDATHIACSSFCDAVISEDVRLIKKAKAIFTFKQIHTEVFQLST